jgi:hypothetical protein
MLGGRLLCVCSATLLPGLTRCLGGVLGLALISPLWASEADALGISANIQAMHMPFGTILDPTFASATSNQIVGYTRCGDSALWTGAYLAAEAFPTTSLIQRMRSVT